jgi:hypothetical protein
MKSRSNYGFTAKVVLINNTLLIKKKIEIFNAKWVHRGLSLLELLVNHDRTKMRTHIQK